MPSVLKIKEQIHQLADQLPDEATWDDVAREVAFRQAVQQGKADVEAGQIISHEQIKRKWENKLANQLDQ